MQIETPPSDKPYDKPEGERRGIVIVNTGDGKGKSTAAFGVALRAHGRGKAVKIFQFMKVLSARFVEHRMFEQIGIPNDGLGDGFSWKSQDMEHSAQLARNGWQKAKAAILSGEYFMGVVPSLGVQVRCWSLQQPWVFKTPLLLCSSRCLIRHIGLQSPAQRWPQSC